MIGTVEINCPEMQVLNTGDPLLHKTTKLECKVTCVLRETDQSVPFTIGGTIIYLPCDIHNMTVDAARAFGTLDNGWNIGVILQPEKVRPGVWDGVLCLIAELVKGSGAIWDRSGIKGYIDLTSPAVPSAKNDQGFMVASCIETGTVQPV